MIDLPKGDAFAVRNKYAMKIDYEKNASYVSNFTNSLCGNLAFGFTCSYCTSSKRVLRYTSEIGEEGY